VDSLRRDSAGAALAVPAATEDIRNGTVLLTLDPPGSIDTRPFAISDAGDIVGLYITPPPENRTRKFLLTRGVYTSIDVPGSIRTNALGVTILRPARGSDPDRLAVVAATTRSSTGVRSHMGMC